jgi:hypothetical protein
MNTRLDNHSEERRPSVESVPISPIRRRVSVGLVPFVDGPKKRQRSASPIISNYSSKIASRNVMDDEEESQQPARPVKKRKRMSTPQHESDSDDQPSISMDNMERKQSTSARDVPSNRQPQVKASGEVDTSQSLSSLSIVPDSQQVYEGPSESLIEIEQQISPPRKDKNPPVLRPIPQISPTIFRGRLEQPLSQIEEFTSPEHSPKPSKKQLEIAANRARSNHTSATKNVQQRTIINHNVSDKHHLFHR